MKRIKNVAYIHDLGGTKNIDGMLIKSKLLYRSAQLSKLKTKEVNLLVNDYNVKNVIDLRTIDETKYNNEDFLRNSLKYYHVPLVSNDMNPAVTKENRVEVLDYLVNLPGGMRQHIIDLYREIIKSKQAIDGYRDIFKLLLSNDNSEGFLFHCTQGKDRTGIVVYLVLSSLGIPQETIEKIYLSFNRRARFKRAMYFLGMNIRFTWAKAVAVNDTLTAKLAYIHAAIDEINTKFNGVKEYLKNQIGLSEGDFLKLKQIYLQ